jgi:hypothetical protein
MDLAAGENGHCLSESLSPGHAEVFMKPRFWAISIAAAALLILPAASIAQQQHCGKCASCPCCAGEEEQGATPQAEKAPAAAIRGYDMSLEQRLTGVVVSAIELPGSTELVVTVSNGENSFEVQVGPADWMADKGYSFVPGEGVEILGSMLWSEGNDTIVARQIWKGGEEIRLRDETGQPLWVGAQRPS